MRGLAVRASYMEKNNRKKERKRRKRRKEGKKKKEKKKRKKKEKKRKKRSSGAPVKFTKDVASLGERCHGGFNLRPNMR
jgi:hypothetical protein